MRSTGLRLVGTLSVCLMALLFTGCGSNNTGKIVGTWKRASPIADSKDHEDLRALGMTTAWEFKADGTFALIFVAERDTPEVQGAVQRANADLAKKKMSGKYRLGMGNLVTFTGASKDMFGGGSEHTYVSITGDTMTWKDSDGTTAQFVRVK